MGGDFLLAHCELPWDAKAMRPILLDRIEKASSDKSVHSYLEDILYSEFEELEQELEEISESDLFSLDQLLFFRKKEEVRTYLTNAVDYLFYSEGYLRDVTEINIKGSWFLFSGGMSWGDGPTESFSYINSINMSGITDGLGEPKEER